MEYLDYQLNDYFRDLENDSECYECGAPCSSDDKFCSEKCHRANQI